MMRHTRNNLGCIIRLLLIDSISIKVVGGIFKQFD